MRDNPILRVTAKILFAPIIVFGLYASFMATTALAADSRRG